jgi:hypothetical protein
MTFKIFINAAHNIVHRILVIGFMMIGVVMMFCAEPLGAIIILLAMIEDSVYRRR